MPSRRALSEPELDAAKAFKNDVLKANKGSYACGGIIPSSILKVEDLILYYTDPTTKDVDTPNAIVS